ncbi:hypothetical protein PIB30_024451 [Stylosanthes scabra]|uniref:Aminotransferase-like plant mobile domain-containing protein n=1 Tax=Stylosanthes scabra TaxID=79078 RepID=A0ABU6W7Q4_9FABA|nr:hypothetical protein [Stylosanthes scabra]
MATYDVRVPRITWALCQISSSFFVCHPYMTLEVAFLVDRDIWRAENMRFWTSLGSVQNYPHRPLNIDWLHARDGRGGDRWFPTMYRSWHGRWDSRHEQTFPIVEVQDPSPSTDYLRLWHLAARRFLAPDNAFYPRPPNEIPPEAIQRVVNTLPRGTQVDHALDNRCPDRRRMFGTRTTDRDWQWLNGIVGEDVVAPRRVRRMPEDGGPSQQSEVPPTPSHHFDSSTPVFGSPSHDFFVGLISPRFQRTLQPVANLEEKIWGPV